MKALSPSSRRLIALLPLVVLMAHVLGCASTKKVDWNSRIGAYTFDQAVTEMGPPDRQAKTSDGKTVAEWIRRRSGGSSITIGTGFYGRHSAVGVGHTVGSGYQEDSTRLTFDAEGKLLAWAAGR